MNLLDTVNHTDNKHISKSGTLRVEASVAGMPIITFFDARFEVNIISKKLLEKLNEGRDYEYIKDIIIRDETGKKMKTEGRVKLIKRRGICFNNQSKPVEIEATVREEFTNQNWKILIGTPFMFFIGNLWSSVGGDPIAWFQNKNEEIVELDGNIPELIALNLIPDCATPIIATRNMNIKITLHVETSRRNRVNTV